MRWERATLVALIFFCFTAYERHGSGALPAHDSSSGKASAYEWRAPST